MAYIFPVLLVAFTYFFTFFGIKKCGAENFQKLTTLSLVIIILGRIKKLVNQYTKEFEKF